jgi:hypothetical protein
MVSGFAPRTRLYEQENNRFKLVKEIKGESFKTSPGIMVLSPSDSTPELTVGKRYRWQVELERRYSNHNSGLG